MARNTMGSRDWRPTQDALLCDIRESPAPQPQHHDSGKAGFSSDPRHRLRSFSSSFPWPRPKSTLTSPTDYHPSYQANEAVIDDTFDSNIPISAQAPTSGNGSSSSGLKSIVRRASKSLKGMVHRRPSAVAEDAVRESKTSAGRPTTSHSIWPGRLRQPKSFRHSRSFYGIDFTHEPLPIRESSIQNPYAAGPGTGLGPPVIPENTGAAAKASAAMQNEYLARSLQNNWLTTSPSDDNNDRESGIGIAVSVPGVEVDTAETDSIEQDISRVDFITMLPLELAIHILASLDALALGNASSVSRSWNKISSNQHVWRESCLREMTTTYATSAPVQPNRALGIPKNLPSSDWREIYRAKQELNQRWKSGMAKQIYLNGHQDSIYCVQFDEYKLITGSRDKTIRVWDLHTLACRLVIGPDHILDRPELLRDEHDVPVHYATGSDSKRVLGRSVPEVVSFPTHHDASILCLQYDDEILVTGSSDATCIVHDIKAGYRPIRRLQHHTAAVLDLAFDSKHIVTCSKDISICVWDRATGALLRQLKGHTGPVNAVQMRGNTIVSCSGDYRVKLWNIDTGKNIREFSGHTKGLACSQFSEDGRFIASAGNDQVIRVWDANTGELIRQMQAHDGLVRSLHIDSVSGRLVSASYDTDIKVWDMETGKELLYFPHWHSSWVLSAKNDYRRIVSTGQDPKILIQDFGADVRGIELLESDDPDEVVTPAI